MSLRNVSAKLALILLLTGSVSADEEARYFKSKDGKTMKATLVTAVGDRVTIKKDNGREYTVPITSFSLEDQKYLRDWIKNNPNAIKYAFEIEAKAFKQKVTGKDPKGSFRRVTTEQWAYEVSIQNRARNDVQGVVAKYRVFLEDRVSAGGYENSRKTVMFKGGEEKLPKMTFNGKGAFVSKPHTIQKLRSQSYLSKRNNERDRMRGVWIRLYRKDKMIHEWKSTEIPKDLKWDDKGLVDAEKVNKYSSGSSRTSGN